MFSDLGSLPDISILPPDILCRNKNFPNLPSFAGQNRFFDFFSRANVRCPVLFQGLFQFFIITCLHSYLGISSFEMIFVFFQDLIKYTPVEHPDYEMLQTFMKRAQEFLERNYSQQPEVDVSVVKYTRNQK